MIPDLNLKFSFIRTNESNFSNVVADVVRKESSADCCLLSSGSLRSDKVYPANALYSIGDLFDIYPFEKELCVIELSGEDLYKSLECGVSKYPALEGRFPQTSHIHFEFNPHRPAGQRVNRDTIQIAGEPLESERIYTMAMCHFLADGRDGYDPFKGKRQLIDPNSRQQIRQVLMDFFSKPL